MIGMSGNWPWTYSVPTAGGAGVFEGARLTFCVSGPAMAGAWEVNPDAVTVTHTVTSLTWHRTASANEQLTWAEGLAYCEASTVGGFTDWRLPTLREYVSVFDLDTGGDFMSEAFGAVPTGAMLTGTPPSVGFNPEPAYVNESTGDTDQQDFAFLTGGARCVRGPD